MRKVDYNAIASEYNQRYKVSDYAGFQASITAFVRKHNAAKVLEVGCGTGRWLRLLKELGCEYAGLDRSSGMLAIAREQLDGDLREGSAESLPWEDAAFDCVQICNAFHHFPEKEAALREAYRVTKPGGGILLIGLDPHEASASWFVYDYFPESYEADLVRYPSRAQQVEWLTSAGFIEPTVAVAEPVRFSVTYDQALESGVLKHSFTSQLTVLTDDEYAAGMDRLRAAAEANKELRLEGDFAFYSIEARKPA